MDDNLIRFFKILIIAVVSSLACFGFGILLGFWGWISWTFLFSIYKPNQLYKVFIITLGMLLLHALGCELYMRSDPLTSNEHVFISVFQFSLPFLLISTFSYYLVFIKGKK